MINIQYNRPTLKDVAVLEGGCHLKVLVLQTTMNLAAEGSREAEVTKQSSHLSAPWENKHYVSKGIY